MCRRKIIWTEEKLQIIRDNYPTMVDRKLAEILDVTSVTLRSKAKELGLQKHSRKWKITPSVKKVIISMYKNHSYRCIAAKTGLSINSVRNFIKSCISEGQEIEERTKEETWKIISETRKNIIKKERALEVWGLKRKTNLRVTVNIKSTIMRSQLRKKGYELDHGGKDVFIYNIYRRDPNLESKAARMGFTFFLITAEEDENGNQVFEETNIDSK